MGIASLAWNLIKTLKLVREQRVVPIPSTNDRELPELDILVPVKDEAQTICKCLDSVVNQDYSRRRILVVNDRSTDGTDQAIRQFRELHPEVLQFDVKELPSGLYGKPHALHTLVPHLKGELIAFVDSDLYLQPHCMRTLVHQLINEKLDWIPVMGKPEIRGFWETLLVPILGAVSFAWYDPRKISDPAWPNAIGSALMVCRRSAYEAIGGHECVIRAYDEDSEIIRIAKRAGQRVSFLLTPELFTQRHYGSLSRTIMGITRTFIGGLKTIPRMLLTINALSFVSLFPLGLLTVLGVVSTVGYQVPHLQWWVASAFGHIAISLALAIVIYKTAGTPKLISLLHPLGSLVMIAICIRAMRQLIGGTPITWRGTTYS